MIPLDCVCASTRRAARLITQMYSHEISSGVEPSQFLLLSAIDRKPGCAQVMLGDMLGYDKTTLSRSLRLMQKNGWLKIVKAQDHRERGYTLTSAGKKLLAVTTPDWQQAQKKVKDSMTEAEWGAVSKAFEIVARVAAEWQAAG